MILTDSSAANVGASAVNAIILYEQTDESISTQSTLFVGTEQECEEQIVKEGLTWPVESEITA